MDIDIKLKPKTKPINFKIIGIGGAGCNSIKLLMENCGDKIDKNSLYVANTDFEHLKSIDCPNKIYIGKSTQGYGAGGDPEVAYKSAQESTSDIEKIIEDTDLLILTAGLGKGTGSGATQVFAELAEKHNVLTVAIVTTPFEELEGTKAAANAKKYLDQLSRKVNSYIVISNELLLQHYSSIPTKEALRYSNHIIENTIMMFDKIINVNEMINIDFNDLKNSLVDAKNTIVSVGNGFGENKVDQSVDDLLSLQLFNSNYESCRKVILIIEQTAEGTLDDVKAVKAKIAEKFSLDENCQLSIGMQSYHGATEKDKALRVSLIATNVDDINNQINLTQTYDVSNTGIHTGENDKPFGDSDRSPDFFNGME